MKSILIIYALSILSIFGCAAPSVPYRPSQYDDIVSKSSNLTANIIHLTGVVSGSNITNLVGIGNGVFVPISVGSFPNLQFNEEDQSIFIKSLCQELERLHLFKSAVTNSTSPCDIEIQILFAQTFHQHVSTHKYILDVAIQIKGGDDTFVNRHRIVSDDGDSWFERMKTNASDGKAKAGKKLMVSLIGDVESWLSAKKFSK